jgi:homoserine dehydrogenase
MAYIAVMGYGIVGSGMVNAFTKNAGVISARAGEDITVKRILDLRDFSGDPLESCLTKDFNDILNDGEITVVAEMMGRIEPAYTYTKALLTKGVSVVTSNKELVAAFGAELLGIARDNGASYLFEGSVCGGIPVIRTISGSLLADNIRRISGIMNGTTNYILTQMASGGDYADALTEAQKLGYAESDPSDDVLAKDSCRKLAILLSLITGRRVDYNDIYTEGIDKLTYSDVVTAKALGCSLKLIASADIDGREVSARVTPALVPEGNPLCSVNGVFNAAFLECDVTGGVMLYGHGAGSLPTGGAVAADIIECVMRKNTPSACFWTDERQEVLPHSQSLVKKAIRVSAADRVKAESEIYKRFDVEKFVKANGLGDDIVFVTKEMREGKINDGVGALKNNGIDIISQLTIY